MLIFISNPAYILPMFLKDTFGEMRMLSGHTNKARIQRGLFGLAGSSMVLMPAFGSWIDNNLSVGNVNKVILATEYGVAISMVMALIMAIWVIAIEEDSHWYSCFFKGVGMPGSILGVVHIFRYSVT